MKHIANVIDELVVMILEKNIDYTPNGNERTKLDTVKDKLESIERNT